MGLSIQNILQRFPNLEGFEPSASDLNELASDFDCYLYRQTRAGILDLSNNYLLLKAEYSILCQQLIKNLRELSWEEHYALLKQRLISAHLFSQLLEHIASKQYINQQEDAALFINKKRAFHYLLSDDHYPAPVTIETSMSTQIRTLTGRATFWRLVFARLRRLSELLILMLAGLSLHQGLDSCIHDLALPFLSDMACFFRWIAWLFYVPRLVSNSKREYATLLEYRNLPEDQKAFGLVKIKNELATTAYDQLNDGPWIGFNAAVCIDHVSCFGPSITLVGYGYDVLIAGLRAFMELRLLLRLETLYRPCDPNNPEEDPDYWSEIKKKIRCEAWRHAISILGTLTIFIGGCFALSMFAHVSLMPLVGSLFLVTASLSRFITDKVQPERPKDDPENLAEVKAVGNHGFFASENFIPKEEGNARLIFT